MAAVITPEYIAGLVDGEGCITINKTGRWGAVSLTITNTCKSVLDDVCSYYQGGLVSLHHRASPPRRQCWTFRAYGKSAVKIILSIAAYLRIKRNQAALALYYWRSRRKLKAESGHKGFKPLPTGITNTRTTIMNKIHLLNKRGVS